jgi:hypothetical protein
MRRERGFEISDLKFEILIVASCDWSFWLLIAGPRVLRKSRGYSQAWCPQVMESEGDLESAGKLSGELRRNLSAISFGIGGLNN